MASDMELKAYKLLAQIRGRMLSSIMEKARNKVSYSKNKKEDAFELFEWIANPGKWDYCGILDDKDKAILETLEYLLDDEKKEIIKYREWLPTN